MDNKIAGEFQLLANEFRDIHRVVDAQILDLRNAWKGNDADEFIRLLTQLNIEVNDIMNQLQVFY